MKNFYSLIVCFALLSFYCSSALRLRYSFDQDACLLRSLERGKPQNRTNIFFCDDNNYTIGETVCFKKCKPGYVNPNDNIGYCGPACPQGFNAQWFLCSNTYRGAVFTSYGTKSECETYHRNCSYDNTWKYIPNCVGGESLGSIKLCANNIYSTSTRDPKSGLGCKQGFEEIDGLCYPSCPSGQIAVDKKTCTKPCPAGYTQCGAMCMKGASCANSQGKNLEVFLAGVQAFGEKVLSDVDLELNKVMCA